MSKETYSEFIEEVARRIKEITTDEILIEQIFNDIKARLEKNKI